MRVPHRSKGLIWTFWNWKEDKECLTLLAHLLVLHWLHQHCRPICCSFLALLDFILFGYRGPSAHDGEDGHVPHPPTTHTPSHACGTWLQRQHCSSFGCKSRSPREGLLGREIVTQEGCWEILPSRLIAIATVVYYINYSQFYFVKRKFRRTSYLAQIIQVSENHILKQ